MAMASEGASDEAASFDLESSQMALTVHFESLLADEARMLGVDAAQCTLVYDATPLVGSSLLSTQGTRLAGNHIHSQLAD